MLQKTYKHSEVQQIVSEIRVEGVLDRLAEFETDILDILEMDKERVEIMSEAMPLDRASQRALDILETRIEVMKVYAKDALSYAIHHLSPVSDSHVKNQAELLKIKQEFLKANHPTNCLDFVIDGTLQYVVGVLKRYCKAE